MSRPRRRMKRMFAGIAMALAVGLAGPGNVLGQGRTPGRTGPTSAARRGTVPRVGAPRVHEGVSLGAFNRLYRPSVVLRKGTGRGSGTILASEAGDTLILTAAHVLRTSGAVEVELQAHNLGLPNDPKSAQRWPRVVPAEILASDVAADVALVRVRGLTALPYAARMAFREDAPEAGQTFTALGYDGARQLIGWRTTMQARAMVDLGQGGGMRPFVVTARPSVKGRSGGGLFLDDGTVVGVCVGRFEIEKGRWVGLFASLESVYGVLDRAKQTGRVRVRESRKAPG